MSRPVVVSPVKAILAMRFDDASGLPASRPKPLTTLMTPGGQNVADQLDQRQDRERRLFGGLQDDAVAGGDRGGELPHRHQEREVPGNDLADDAERLMVVVGDGIVVDLAERAFLGAERAGEIAPVVDAQRQVGGGRLADRLAVVEGFDERQEIEIGLHAVGDLEQDKGAVGDRGPAPGVLGRMGRVERQLDVGRRGAWDRAQLLAGDRARIVEVAPLDRGDPLAADEIVVLFADQSARRNLVNRRLIHGVSSAERVAVRSATADVGQAPLPLYLLSVFGGATVLWWVARADHSPTTGKERFRREATVADRDGESRRWAD